MSLADTPGQLDTEGSDTTADAAPDVLQADLTADDAGQSCPGGTFCACEQASDCISGFCLETAGGKQCAPLCAEGCPKDWRCISVGGDIGSYCAPIGVRDCAPCATNADCNASKGVPSACIALGSAGSFCATTCAVSADCATGSVCSLTPDASQKVCQPKDGLGSCGCSAWAVAQGATTPCVIPDGNQLCPGTRQCGVAGLGACALVPNEVCYDANCKSVADGVPCNDGDACTASTTCQDQVCQGGVPACECKADSDCAGQDDGNLCNGKLYCDLESHTCVVNPVTVVQCPVSTNPCMPNVCEPATGACSPTQLPDAVPCDDGKACTIGDICTSGACVSGTVTCNCAADADCAAYEDGNLCNGKLFCNKAKGQCQINPATVVSCQTGLDTACLQHLCQPETGKCAAVPATDGKKCDDDNACTAGDACKDGACISGTNLCVCAKDADCAAQEDDNLCNGSLYCDLLTNTCALNPASIVQCPNPNPATCTPLQCQPQTGECVATPLLAGPCSDGDPCTGGDQCESGVCVGKVALCQCETAADCSQFNDADACNGQLYCDTASNLCKVNPTSVVVCEGDKSACTLAVCNPASGACEPGVAPDGQQCQDGEPCTKNDQCAQGQCVAGKSVCACYLDAQCASQDDGDRCNGVWFCDRSDGPPKCAFDPSSVVSCDQAGMGMCAQMVCEPESGSCNLVVSDGAGCDDGDACTAGDVCQAMTCLPGSAVSCDDGDSCTLDSCAAATGCVHALEAGCALLPYHVEFACDLPLAWTLEGIPGGPLWAVDTTPGVNLPGASQCTLNFNNGSDYTCVAGAESLAEQFATSPWFDALSLPQGAPLVLKFRYAGGWEQEADWDVLRVQARPYGGSWSDVGLVASLFTAAPVALGWQTLRLGLTPEQTGARFQIRFGFGTKDCINNGTMGPFIDELSIAPLSCAVTADCDDGAPCSLPDCVSGTCVWSLAADAMPCSHDSACAIASTCTSGACTAGGLLDCDDQNPCTADSCQADSGCQSPPADDQAPCDGLTVDDRCHVVVGLADSMNEPNWALAKARCQAWGGTIGPLRSWHEAEQLRNAMAANNPPLLDQTYWLGLSDGVEDGVLRWPDGTRPLFDLFIEVGFANTPGQLDCAQWRPDYPGGPLGDWVPASCDEGTAQWAICSKPLARLCDDGQPCTIADRCEAGVCQGAQAVSNAIPPLWNQPRFWGVAFSGHGAMLVGQVGYDEAAIAWPVDSAGRPRRALADSVLPYGVQSRLVHAAADRHGYAAVGRSRGDKDPKVEQGLFVRYGFGGEQLMPASSYGGAGMDMFHAVVPSGSAYFLVGVAGGPSFGVDLEAGWVVKVDADGKELWSKTYSVPNGGYMRFYGAVGAPDGGVVAVGTVDGSGWMVRISAAGDVIWSHSINTGGPASGSYTAVAATATGVVAVANGANSAIEVRAVSWSGVQQWLSVIDDGNGSVASTAIAAQDNEIVVSAQTWGFGADTPLDGLVAKLSADGKLMWLRRMPKSSQADGQTFAETINSVAIDPLYRGILAVGQDNAGLISGQLWLLRLDPHGNDTCEGQAACLLASTPSCDDGLPCTMDWCDATNGDCTHQPAPDGVFCSAGQTCQSGVCK